MFRSVERVLNGRLLPVPIWCCSYGFDRVLLWALWLVVRRVNGLVILRSPFQYSGRFLEQLTSRPLRRRILSRRPSMFCSSVSMFLRHVSIRKVLYVLLHRTNSLSSLRLIGLRSISKGKESSKHLARTLYHVLAQRTSSSINAHRSSPNINSLRHVPTTNRVVATISTLRNLVINALGTVLCRCRNTPIRHLRVVRRFVTRTVEANSCRSSRRVLGLRHLLMRLTRGFRFNMNVNVDLRVDRVLRVQVLPTRRNLTLLRLLHCQLPTITVTKVRHAIITMHTSSTQSPSVAIEAKRSYVCQGLLGPRIEGPLPSPKTGVVMMR